MSYFMVGWGLLTFHHLARNDPVGQVAILRHLQRPEHRKMHLGAANHAKGFGGGEGGGTLEIGDGFLPGIDNVSVLCTFLGVGTHAQQPVLRLQFDRDT